MPVLARGVWVQVPLPAPGRKATPNLQALRTFYGGKMMNFRERHPYLFWELIGWGLLIADFAFAVISFIHSFGEWIFPVIFFRG